MDVEKNIECLLNNQAKHDTWHAQANERLTRIEAVLGMLANNVERLDETMVTLAESGIATNRLIDKLGERVDQFVSAVGVIASRLTPPPHGER